MNSILNSSKTEMKLSSIFQERFNIDLNKYNGNVDYKDSKLLSDEFRLVARDLIYLLHDIEDEFNITIPQEDIDDGKFDTINNIIRIINNQLIYKSVEGI